MSEQLTALAASAPPERIIEDEQRQAEMLASLADVAAPDRGEPARSAMYDTFVNSRIGRRVAVGSTVLGVSGVGAPAVAMGSTESPAPGVTTSVTIRTSSASLSAKGVAEKNITIGEDVRLKGKINWKKCHWTKGAFKNSMRLANGKIVYYHDPVKARLCRSKASPTGYVKVAGGSTGRKCFNPAADRGPVPGPMVKGEVLNVSKLNMRAKLHAIAEVIVAKECGIARGKGEVIQHINLKSHLRLRGSAQSQRSLVLRDKAVAEAEASVSCKDTTTTVTIITPPTTPETCITNPALCPPPKVNNQPTIEANNPAHDVHVNGQVENCATTFDADGDQLLTRATAQRGTVSNIYRKDPNNPNILCVRYTAPGTVGNDTLIWTTQDNKNASGAPDNVVDDSVALTFPVVKDEF